MRGFGRFLQLIGAVVKSYTCCKCDKSTDVPPDKRGTHRLPRGWKSVSGSDWCGDCWGKSYVVRAVTLPIWGVIDGGDIAGLWDAAREAWKAATCVLNWASTTLYQQDVRRGPADEKLGKMPETYLYGLAKSCPAWHRIEDKQSGGALLLHAEQVYRADRYEVLWTAGKSLRNYRYPQPYPISSQAVRLLEHNEIVAINLRCGGSRWTLKLGAGQRYTRQQAGLRHLLANPDLVCECAIYPISADGDARQASAAADNSGAPKRREQLAVKIVGWFPVDDRKPSGTLRVSTNSAALLVATTPDGDRVWTYHADHARQAVARHEAHLNGLSRLSDDRKAERRKPRRDNRELVGMVDDRSRKDRDRMRSLLHEVSASVVAFAKRRRCAAIEYDDTDRSFAASMPWRMLMTITEQKCRANGIRFVDLSSVRQAKKKRTARGSVPVETTAPLATE